MNPVDFLHSRAFMTPTITIGNNFCKSEYYYQPLGYPDEIKHHGVMSDNISKTISKRIHDMTRKRGVTLSQLAVDAGMTQGYMSQLLNNLKGKRWNVEMLEAVAEQLKCEVWELLVDPRDVIPKKYIDLMDAYECLDGQQRVIVDGLLTAAKLTSDNKKQNELKKTSG